ncbi:EamA family transporter [Helcobacillus massiliensis]|uniref:Inner membrane transporter RhtA n=1 Tax=Helcobacillus massiliensis TaxID=521392 RepID=A0A839QNV7_9MICO|nr:DMT family transporter [Helcobacillus massiliensis]MBB3022173.1 inner membrane transporter RhtA [Helcobacillus massiliensis]
MSTRTTTGSFTVVSLDGQPTDSPTTGFISDAPTTGSPTAGIPIVAEIVQGQAELTESPRSGRGTLVGALFVLASATSLQIGASLGVSLFPAFGPWGTTSLRLLVAAVVLMLITRPAIHRWTLPQWRAVGLFGVVLAVMNGFFFAAIDRLPLGVAVAIEFIGPLTLAAVLSRRARDLAWVGLAVLGIGLFFVDDLMGHGGAALDPLGVLFILIAAACWATYIVVSQRTGQLVSGAGGLAVAVAIAGVLLLPFGITALPTAVSDLGLLTVVIACALLATVIPYSLEFAALRRLPKSAFGVLLSLEPMVAALVGWLFLGQGISLLAVLAIVVIMGASVGSTAMAAADDTAPRPVTGAIPAVDCEEETDAAMPVSADEFERV